MAESKSRFENVVEVSGNAGICERGREKRCQEGIFGRGIVDESEVEVAKRELEVVDLFVFFGKKGR